MRSALLTILGKNPDCRTAHPGLLYERYAPLVYDEPPGTSDQESKIGKIHPPKIQEDLLREVASIPVSPAYRAAWRRWHGALQASGAVTRVVEATGRLLLGHGNPAPTEVGIALHHVYGVPLLPGTALKGLLNHYLSGWGRPTDEEWRGVGYDDGGRLKEPPGVYHGALFGIPNLPLGDGREQDGQAGGVVFEDAWLIPGEDALPLCADVLTPHQGAYYRNCGEQPPNDWTDPIPVTFLTVKPKTRFLLAVSPARAGSEGAELAMAHLLDALEQWGVGAKTRAGYGRLCWVVGQSPTGTELTKRAASGAAIGNTPLSAALQLLETAVAAVLQPPDREQAPPVAERLDLHITDALLEALAPEDRVRARSILKAVAEHAGLKKRRKERLAEIMKRVAQ